MIPEQLVPALITVHRQPAYIHDTLASLWASGGLVGRLPPVRLYVGTADSEYVERYASDPRLIIYPLDEELWAEIAEWHVKRRLSFNRLRALCSPLPDEARGLLFLEDDIVFREQFVDRLCATIDELEATGVTDYLLAAGAGYDFESMAEAYRGRLQCCYLPRTTLSAICPQLKRRGVDSYEQPGDLLLGQLCAGKIYATNRDLVNHVGATSSCHSGGGESQTFWRPWQPLERADWGNDMPMRRKLALATVSVHRDPCYLHQTLDSLFKAGAGVRRCLPVHLFVGTNDVEYVGRYHANRRTAVHLLSPEEWNVMRPFHVHRRAAANYLRALEFAANQPGGTLIFEDDVLFRDALIEKLHATLDEMEGEHQLTDYVLSCYDPYDLERRRAAYRGRMFCQYTEPFYGNQALYWPQHTAREMVSLLKQHAVDKADAPSDITIARFCQHKMYATPRSLVQHVGKKSTGCGDGQHESPSFCRPWRPLEQAEWGRMV